MGVEKSKEFNQRFEKLGGKQKEKKGITDHMRNYYTKHFDASYKEAKKEVGESNALMRPKDLDKTYKEIVERKKAEKQIKATEKESKKLINSLLADMKAQKKYERQLAKHHRHDLSLINRKNDIKNKVKEKIENKEGAAKFWQKAQPNRHKLRLMVSDWKTCAIESLVESASIWKKKTMNSELKKLKQLETKVRGLIPEESQDKIIQPMKNDASMENDVPTANDNRAKYGSDDFEMPRFSRVTEEDLKGLVKQQQNKIEGNEQSKTEENEQNKTEETIESSKIRAEGKNFEEYYRQVSKLQGLEKGYKAEEFRHQIKNSLLIAEIGKLEKQVEYMQEQKDKTIKNEQGNVKKAREAFWEKRIENAQSMIEAKNDERNKIILTVEGEGGIREMLGKIKNEYLKLQGEEVKKNQDSTITKEDLNDKSSNDIKLDKSSISPVDKSSINPEESIKNKIYAEFMQKLVDREQGSAELKEQKDKNKLGANWTDAVSHEYQYLYQKVKKEAKKEKIEAKKEEKSFTKMFNMDFKLTFNKEMFGQKSREIPSKKLKKLQDKKLKMSQEEIKKRLNDIQDARKQIRNKEDKLQLDIEELNDSKDSYSSEKEFKKKERELKREEIDLKEEKEKLDTEERHLRETYQEKFIDKYNSSSYNYNGNNFDYNSSYQPYYYNDRRSNDFTDDNFASSSSPYDYPNDYSDIKLHPFPGINNLNRRAFYNANRSTNNDSNRQSFDNFITPTNNDSRRQQLYDNVSFNEEVDDNLTRTKNDNRESYASSENSETNQEHVIQRTNGNEQIIETNQHNDGQETVVNTPATTQEIKMNQHKDGQETVVNTSVTTQKIETKQIEVEQEQQKNLNDVEQK
jgi:hypothetical protein